jgi:hypothetical protein
LSRNHYAHPGYDEGPQNVHRFALYVLMLVIAVAFGGFVWQLYSGPSAPLISPPAGAYKVEPPADAANARDPVEENAFYENLEGQSEGAAVTPRAGPEQVAEATPEPSGPPQLAPAPHFVSNGPFVAQLAALQSESGANAAWQRFSSRAPGLFAAARLDVERADLGQRGVYYRVRAGYFADRANATRFCERIRQMGQDCIVVSR